VTTTPTGSLAQFGSRELFPDLAPRAYLAHAAIAPPSLPVLAAADAVSLGFAREGLPAIVAAKAQAELARERFAQLIGAAPAQVARMSNTSAGVIAVAQGLRWQAGERLLLIEGEFPTNVAPWLQASRERDLEVCRVPLELFQRDGAAALERVERELRRGLRLLAISAVQFASGLRMPLAELGALCQRYGCRYFVDGIQAVGATPLDVRGLGIDFLACGAHKWLMGILGAGFLYVRPEAETELEPRGIGWMSLKDPEQFLFADQGPVPFAAPLGAGAALLEPGVLPFAALAAAAAGMGLLQQLGVPAIFAHINAYHDRIEALFLARGFRSLRATDPGGRSTILSLEPPPGVTLAQVLGALSSAGIAATAPAGCLRLAPHWPNNAERESAAIEAALARL
jgi:selenocysteine lyase/cysteine desulfurase